MNSIEMSEYLYMNGHFTVLLDTGVDIEKHLLGFNAKPVNHFELQRIAKQEGFVLTNDGLWVKITQ